ncbi:glycosyltransferase family 4 protein [Sphaerobolus stellatus SS14]|nr:glycosyltransferase family 4 protein [Sphaerobolus stellatus SS14]
MYSLWTVLPILLLVLSYVAPALFVLSRRQTIHAKSASKRNEILTSLGVRGTSATQKRFIGFFHPYCNAGGGGERVLWAAIAYLQRTEPNVINVVYSGDQGVTKEDIINKVKARFDISLNPASLHFIFLKSRNLVEDSTWPRFTLLGQSLGSIYLAWEAISRFSPDLFIDTMGYAFTFYLVRLLADIPVGAYVHFPTISTEMVRRVRSRTAWHTNSGAISTSTVLSVAKLLYYQIFMFYYSRSLQNASFVMVNSTWTKNHVDSVLEYGVRSSLIKTLHTLISPIFLRGPLGGLPDVPRKPTQVAYPSCDTKQMSKFPLEGRQRIILSLAQFRPEKDHAAQLHSLAELFKLYPEYRQGKGRVQLFLMGSSRNADDTARVDKLKALAKELRIESNVEFKVNVPFPELLENLSKASIGLNTMVDEHFGINVVEFMASGSLSLIPLYMIIAAGLIPVAHASGGPLNDIIVPRNGKPTGYHCTNPVTFAEAFHSALSLPKAEDLAMRRRAREHAVERFSEREFELAWERGGWSEWKIKLGLEKNQMSSI